MRCFSFLSLLSLFMLPAFAAQAASSDWYHIEGGSIRIVTSDIPATSGELRGALEIKLKPGWKTYWRDPGASGVAPAIDVMAGTQAAPVAISFPPPARFDDGYGTWAGYDRSVALALTMTLPIDARSLADLQASIFLGLCETICIPISITLALNPVGNASDPVDVSTVEAAFAALPQPAQPGFSAKLISKNDDAILIEAFAPKGTNIVDLFVSGTQALALDIPQKIQNGSQTLFRVPIITSGEVASREELVYTLISDNSAVSGQMRLP